MNILFLSPWFPYPPDNGSKIRIINHLRNLSLNHEVRLITFYREGEIVDPQGLAEICQLEAYIPFKQYNPKSWKSIAGFFFPIPRSAVDNYSSQMAEQVRRSISIKPPELIIASEIYTAIYGGSKFSIPNILDEMQLGMYYQLYTSSSSILTKLRKHIYQKKINTYARYLTSQYQAYTVASDVERHLLAKIVNKPEKIYVIPNGVDINYYKPGIVNPILNTLIYNGSLTFNANYDAMSYFLAEIFPTIRRSDPNIKLRITGRTEGVDIASLHLDEQVILTGNLPDVRTEVSRSWVCVVPLRYGGGTRLKILEAMALGTPVVATTKAVEGLCVTPGQNVLIGDNPEDFSSHVLRVLHDPGLHDMLSKNGRALVEKSYGLNVIGDHFNSLIEQVIKECETKKA